MEEQTTTPAAMNLDDASRQQIRDARKRRKRIDKVLGVAMFNGVSEAVFAGLSVLIALVAPTVIGILAALSLLIITYVEFHGRSLVQTLNPKGLTYLANNQLVFGILIILYAVSQLYYQAQGVDPHLAELASLGEIGEQIAELEQAIVKIVYISLIAGTIIFQGGMALFYHRSRKHLQRFVSDTPTWVIDVLKAAQ